MPEKRRVPPPFIDPRKVPFVRIARRGELPHLYKPCCTYFVTFRLLDAVGLRSLPAEEMDDMFEVAKANEPPLKLGSCILQNDAAASLIQNALLFFHGDRYWLGEWCIMPNHVHVLVTPLETYSMRQILHSWKSFSAHRANEILGLQGSLWERESFDHACRSLDHAAYFAWYIRQNPATAKLCARSREWKWGSAALRSMDKPPNAESKFWWETEGQSVRR